uniref:Uncharacterized protein n=1 Tax=Parastrongyloides trichosuri TaxID=131310 RepID=A0A0N4ZHK8_PARTI
MQSYFLLSIILSIFVVALIANGQQYDDVSVGYSPEKKAMRNALVRFGRAGMRNALVRFGKRSSDNEVQEFALKRNAAPQPFVRFGRSANQGFGEEAYYVPYNVIYANTEA